MTTLLETASLQSSETPLVRVSSEWDSSPARENALVRIAAAKVRDLRDQGAPSLEELSLRVRRDLRDRPSVVDVINTVVASMTAIAETTLEPVQRQEVLKGLPLSADEALIETGDLPQYLWDIAPAIMHRLENRTVQRTHQNVFSELPRHTQSAVLLRPDHETLRNQVGLRITTDHGSDQTHQTIRRVTVRVSLGDTRDDIVMVLRRTPVGSVAPVFYQPQFRNGEWTEVRQEVTDLESDLSCLEMIRVVAKNMLGFSAQDDALARHYAEHAGFTRDPITVGEAIGASASREIVALNGSVVDTDAPYRGMPERLARTMGGRYISLTQGKPGVFAT